MALIDQLGGEGYANEAELEANTAWESSGVITPVARAIFGVGGEQWIQGNSTRIISRQFSLPQDGVANEFEMSGAVYIPAGSVNPSTGLIFLRAFLGTINSQRLVLQTGPDPVEGDNRQIDLLVSGANVSEGTANNPSSTTLFPTGVRVSAGQVYYMTLRARAQTASGVADGRVESYINGQLVYASSGWEWPEWDWNNASADGLNCQFYTSALGTPRAELRNMTIHDAWTSADGVAPDFKYVVDTTTLSVIDRGGYVDETATATDAAVLAAVTDNDDTTYARGTAADQQLTLGVTMPTGFPVATDISDVIVRARVGKSGAGFNEGQLEVLNNGLSEASQVFTTAALEPAREVQTLRVSGAAIGQGDLQIRVTNDVGGA